MNKQPAIIAIIITAVGLAISAPYSRAACPTDNIPGLSQFQKERQAARLKAAKKSGSKSTGHQNDYHTKKTTR